MKDDRIFLYDSYSGLIVARILTNHGMTLDEMIDLAGYTSNDYDGQLEDEDGEQIDAWYDNLETVYGDEWTADKYIAKPEFADKIYGSENSAPVSMEKIKQLAAERGMAFGDLMEQFEEVEEE